MRVHFGQADLVVNTNKTAEIRQRIYVRVHTCASQFSFAAIHAFAGVILRASTLLKAVPITRARLLQRTVNDEP